MIERSPTEFVTGSGAVYDFANPSALDITIEDLAWGLACEPRFRGQTQTRARRRAFYSVGQHSVFGSWQAPPELAFDFLMHETGEFLFGDMLAPLKITIPEFKRREKECAALLEARFGVKMLDPAAIKRLDQRMLATEKRDLYPQEDHVLWPWTAGAEPFEEQIRPWDPAIAADQFLRRYQELAPL